MSVIVMREEILQVCDALYWDALGARQYLHTICDKPAHPCDTTINEDKETIAAWANRVYIANQIAYILTYAHRGDCDRKIDLFEGDIWKHGDQLIQNPDRFYRIIESIRYNLVSNGGQCILCAEDMQRLDNLSAVLARAVIGEYQRVKGRA